MLNYINPDASKPDQVAIFTREGCQYCAKAKHLLAELGYDYAEIPLTHTLRSKVVGAIASAKTVPQVFVNGSLIGGLDELERWARRAA
jgi:glutaredoxin-like protein